MVTKATLKQVLHPGEFVCLLAVAVIPELTRTYAPVIPNTRVLACYYGTWSKWNGMTPNMIPAKLCTHLILSFADVDAGNKTIKMLDPTDKADVFPQSRILRAENRQLKILLAIGGWNHGVRNFIEVSERPADLNIFTDNVVQFLRAHDLDGLDIDWEYPTDMAKYTSFIQALRLKFDEDAHWSGERRLILTAAVSAGKGFVGLGYDVMELKTHLDFAFVMTYDYHGCWEGKTGHNSPLYARPEHSRWQSEYNVNFTMSYWVAAGMPRDKLVVGMPLYGRYFDLRDAKKRYVGAQTEYWTWPLTDSYMTLCSSRLMDMEQFWDPYSQTPYAVDGFTWLSYDDPNSLNIKAKYVLDEGFAGAMVWSIEQDDFRNTCKQGQYPLVNAIRQVIFKGGPQTKAFPHVPLGPPVLIPSTHIASDPRVIKSPANNAMPDIATRIQPPAPSTQERLITTTSTTHRPKPKVITPERTTTTTTTPTTTTTTTTTRRVPITTTPTTTTSPTTTAIITPPTTTTTTPTTTTTTPTTPTTTTTTTTTPTTTTPTTTTSTTTTTTAPSTATTTTTLATTTTNTTIFLPTAVTVARITTTDTPPSYRDNAQGITWPVPVRVPLPPVPIPRIIAEPKPAPPQGHNRSNNQYHPTTNRHSIPRTVPIPTSAVPTISNSNSIQHYNPDYHNNKRNQTGIRPNVGSIVLSRGTLTTTSPKIVIEAKPDSGYWHPHHKHQIQLTTTTRHSTPRPVLIHRNVAHTNPIPKPSHYYNPNYHDTQHHQVRISPSVGSSILSGGTWTRTNDVLFPWHTRHRGRLPQHLATNAARGASGPAITCTTAGPTCAGHAVGTMLAVPCHCRRFIHCVHNGIGRNKTCPANLHFDSRAGVCNWPSVVKRQDCRTRT